MDIYPAGLKFSVASRVPFNFLQFTKRIYLHEA
jgi:hypothetical protein